MKETIYITGGRSRKAEAKAKAKAKAEAKAKAKAEAEAEAEAEAKAEGRRQSLPGRCSRTGPKAEPARITWSDGAGSMKPEVRSASAILRVTFAHSVVEFLFYHNLSDRVVRAGLSRYSVIRKEPQSATRNLQPAGSAQEAGMFAQRTEMFTQRCETPSQRTEIPSQRSEIPTQWSEIPTQWSEIPTQWSEMPAQRCEMSAQWTEMSAQRTETPARWMETGIENHERRRNIPVQVGAIPEGLYVYRNTVRRENSTPAGVAPNADVCCYKHGMPLASGTLNFKPGTLNSLASRSSKLEAKNISVTSYPSTANSGSVCNLSSNRCPAAAAITAISVLAAVGALWIYRYQCSTGPAARAQKKGGMWMSS